MKQHDYRYIRHASSTCWVILDPDDKQVTTCVTRKEARAIVRQKRELAAREAEAVKIPISWGSDNDA